MLAPDLEEQPRLFVNKRELAKLLRCSIPTLDKLIDDNADFPVEHRGSNGVEWQFDADTVCQFIQAKRTAEAQQYKERSELFGQISLPIEDAPAGGGALTPTQRMNLARARMAERKLAMESGLLVSTAEMRQVLMISIAKFGRFLDTLPAQLGRRHGLPEEVVRAARQYIDEQRRLFVKEMQEALREDENAG